MKISIIHNEYGKFSGEEAVVARQIKLLEAKNHNVSLFTRSSSEIPDMLLGQTRAFFSGVYNPFSKRQFNRFLDEERPDVVHIHNLFPLISPSILPAAKSAGIPIIMTVHNFRLVCPNGLHYVNGAICERCTDGREYWCVRNNCEGSFVKSFGYALRNWWSRVRGYYLDNVCMFACLTKFQHDRLVLAGIPSERLVIVPNMAEERKSNNTEKSGEYIGYSGRLSREKGIEVLVEVARHCKNIPFQAAGNYEEMAHLPEVVPGNFKLLGYCNAENLVAFYSKARFIVLPSVWFEGFPTVLLEAMLNDKAVICSDIGGLSDIVDDGVTGLLTQSGNVGDLEEKIRYLWERPELCQQMGKAGHEKALREYSEERYYQRLMDVYKKAITTCAS